MTTSQATSGVLDSIDGALRDFDTSADAMRWRPEGERETEPRPAEPRPAARVANGPWLDLRDATIVLNRPLALMPDVRMSTPGEWLTGFAAAQAPGPADIRDALAEFVRAAAQAFRPVLEWACRTVHDVHLLLFQSRHRRCWTCHPERRPKPLAVNGHEYQRRLRARRRRRRS